MTPIPPRIPRQSSGSYLAARLIYDTGSKSEAEILESVDFGAQKNVRAAFDYAIKSGWLRLVLDRYELTAYTRAYFDSLPVEEVRKVAEPRSMNLMQRATWKPSKRLPRADEPEWSQRVGITFYTQA